jgi:hypothetical protein
MPLIGRGPYAIVYSANIIGIDERDLVCLDDQQRWWQPALPHSSVGHSLCVCSRGCFRVGRFLRTT